MSKETNIPGAEEWGNQEKRTLRGDPEEAIRERRRQSGERPRNPRRVYYI